MRPHDVFLWALIVLQIIDVITTVLVLRKPGRKEGNPVVRWFMTTADRLLARVGVARGGTIGLVLAKVLLVAPVVLMNAPPVVTLPLIVVYLHAVAVNIENLR